MPEEIAFTINIPIRSADSADVKAAFAFATGYQSTVFDAEGNAVPNPFTTEDLVRQCAQEYIVDITREYIVRTAAEAAKQAAIEQVTTRGAEVTAWFDERRMNSIRPTALAQSISMDEDTTAAIVLEGTDPNNRPLTYSIVSNPAHGTLSGTAPDLVYTPEANWHGVDSFTFQATNVTVASSPATVEITVASVVDPLSANAQSLSVVENRTLPVTLSGYDPEGETLAFEIVAAPEHGTLSGTAPDLVYTPEADYVGADSFTFKAVAGGRESAPAAAAITVATNQVPTAFDLEFQTHKSTSFELSLQGNDPEGDSLTWTVVSPPSQGSLTGTPPNLVYQPLADYVGDDVFTYLCNDGASDSNLATVAISMTNQTENTAPVANSISVSVVQNSSASITLEGNDDDGDPLTWHLGDPPAHGSLSGTAPDLVYTPETDYAGEDSFIFWCNDGFINSNEATVSITVSAA